MKIEDSLNNSYNKFNNIQYDIKSKAEKTLIDDDYNYDDYDKFDENRESVDLDVLKSGSINKKDSALFNVSSNIEKLLASKKSEEEAIEEDIKAESFIEDTVEEESVLKRASFVKDKESNSYSNKFDSYNNYNLSGNYKKSNYNRESSQFTLLSVVMSCD